MRKWAVEPPPPTVVKCLESFDLWAGRLDPNEYTPLIGITGGQSAVSNIANEVNALLMGMTWIDLCIEQGATRKNALLALAANYDTYPGIIACSLELAMLCKRGGSISRDEYIEIILQVYGNDWGAIQTLMCEQWRRMSNTAPIPPRLKTRSLWRQELGHDVLLHPTTLAPCAHPGGIPYLYEGLVANTVLEEWQLGFIFQGIPGKASPSSLRTNSFPSVA